MIKTTSKQAIVFFLALSFLGTLVFLLLSQYFLAHLGNALDRAIIRQLLLLLGVFIPAASAIVVERHFFPRQTPDLGWRLGPWSMYLRTYGTIAFGVLLNYGLTWAFVIPADWTFANFIEQYIPLSSLPLPPQTLFILLPLLTFIIAPILNLLPSLGEELGWRGFLLPRLLPLGRLPAVIISSVLWALWRLPLLAILGFSAGLNSAWVLILNFLMLVAFALWLSYVWLRTESTILTAFMHATFNAGAYTFWFLILSSGSRLLIRSAGLAGAIVFIIFGLYGLYVLWRHTGLRSLVARFLP